MRDERSFRLLLTIALGIPLLLLVAWLPRLEAQTRAPYWARSHVSENRPHLSAPTENFGGAQFTHIATPDNVSQNSTYIDHPLTNGDRTAIILVTQNWNPNGIGGTDNDHPIGVWYNQPDARWAIFNQDTEGMSAGVAFNVIIPPDGENLFVHTATPGNTITNATYINHPLINANPDAILLVTQNWNPPGSVGVLNNHPIGVRYDDGREKWAVFNQDLAGMPQNAAFNVHIPPAGTNLLVHTATMTNTASHWTCIDHPLANDNPNAIVVATQNWNQGGRGVYNDQEIGVRYESAEGKWAVFNQDEGALPQGAAFNIFIPTSEGAFFVHRATAQNTVTNSTFIDHPLTTGNPNAIVLITQNWNPDGGGGVYNSHPIGARYDDGAQKWTISNQDAANIPVDAAFNVLIPPIDGREGALFTHIAAADNPPVHYSYLDHPLTIGFTNTIALVTQNVNPNGSSSVQNNHAIGVQYDSAKGKWSTFNQDLEALPDGAAFNVFIPARDAAVFIHRTTAENTQGHITYIDHRLTNYNPDAFLIITHNRSPDGDIPGPNYDHIIGVLYDSDQGKWAIFNQDLANIPENIAFNVLVKGEGKRLLYLPLLVAAQD